MVLHLGVYQKINPRLIFGSIKGLMSVALCAMKAYENVAQAAGGAASTTGFGTALLLVSAAALGDSNTGMHLLFGSTCCFAASRKMGRGQRVTRQCRMPY
ncbi:CoA transferase [Escherichia coli]